MIRDWWISIRFVSFVFQGSLLCDRPVSGNNRLVKFASQIFMIFLFLVTCKNKATSASFLRQKIHSPSRFPWLFLSSLESFSAKLGEHVTLWFALTPPSLTWLTEQKNPKSLLKKPWTPEIFLECYQCCDKKANQAWENLGCVPFHESNIGLLIWDLPDKFRDRKEREIRNWICNLGNPSQTGAICGSLSRNDVFSNFW